MISNCGPSRYIIKADQGAWRMAASTCVVSSKGRLRCLCRMLGWFLLLSRPNESCCSQAGVCLGMVDFRMLKRTMGANEMGDARTVWDRTSKACACPQLLLGSTPDQLTALAAGIQGLVGTVWPRWSAMSREPRSTVAFGGSLREKWDIESKLPTSSD